MIRIRHVNDVGFTLDRNRIHKIKNYISVKLLVSRVGVEPTAGQFQAEHATVTPPTVKLKSGFNQIKNYTRNTA